MRNPIQLTLLAQRGPITVDAPPPEKYAVHKLLVYGERPQSMRVKATKDLDQAASLIDYLSKNDADALSETWQSLLAKGPGWPQRALQGLQALDSRYPEIETTALWSVAKSFEGHSPQRRRERKERRKRRAKRDEVSLLLMLGDLRIASLFDLTKNTASFKSLTRTVLQPPLLLQLCVLCASAVNAFNS